MKVKKQYYPSKVLLFGEYTIINGSSALAIPFHSFSARWVKNVGRCSHPEILTFLDFLKKNNDKYDFLEFDGLEKDLDMGMCLECDIPIGYGMGSSGAICAAIYDRYKRNELVDISALQSQLAQMENYFHRSSSGMDPLISFYNKPIMKGEDGTYHIESSLSLPDINSKHVSWFLLDTGVRRKTAPLVKIYREKLKKKGFIESYVNPVSVLVNTSIQLVKSQSPINKTMAALSELQYNHMKEMIHPSISDLWNAGLNSSEFHLKLCGAGAGGMTLISVYTDVDNIAELQDFTTFQLVP